MCPQAHPLWQNIASKFVPDYLQGRPFNISAIGPPSPSPPVDPRTTEDCLFLDVVVPEAVLQNAKNSSSLGAPVIVWNFGGGLVSGDKSTQDPAGLLASSQSHGSRGAIFVSFNYRVSLITPYHRNSTDHIDRPSARRLRLPCRPFPTVQRHRQRRPS